MLDLSYNGLLPIAFSLIKYYKSDSKRYQNLQWTMLSQNKNNFYFFLFDIVRNLRQNMANIIDEGQYRKSDFDRLVTNIKSHKPAAGASYKTRVGHISSKCL